MSFVKLSSDFLIESFTLVDNLFINEHLPYCDEKQIKTYIYGLYLCTVPEKDNSLDEMCSVLGVTYDELTQIYEYFEDAGLVRIISKLPLEIKYLSLKRAMQPPKKYRSEKWNDFNVQLQQLFPERMLTPNEYNEYYSFLDSHKLERDAMLMVVKYCINLKGESVRYPYILTVAKSWVAEGVRTVTDVEKKLEEYEAQTEDMREVLKALNRKGGAELEEKQMLLKWTRSWGYELPAILTAASTLKGSKNFKKLDTRLDEFYRMSVFGAEEMRDWQKRRDKLTDLAVRINRNLGVFYESLDHILEVYVVPWKSMGFEDDALVALAHHCFVSGIRTLDGLDKLINKFYAQGLLSVESIDEYISAQVKQDAKIKKIIEAGGRSRSVTNSDREYYRTWSADWGFDDAVILYAAELARDKTYPSSFMNQLLSNWKKQGISSVEGAKSAKHTCAPKKAERDYKEREYTEDELQSVIVSIEKLKGMDL